MKNTNKKQITAVEFTIREMIQLMIEDQTKNLPTDVFINRLDVIMKKAEAIYKGQIADTFYFSALQLFDKTLDQKIGFQQYYYENYKTLPDFKKLFENQN